MSNNGDTYSSPTFAGNAAARELTRATSALEEMIANLDQSTLPYVAGGRLGMIPPGAEPDPRRHIARECGWPANPDINLYSDEYERNPIAHRVITVYPEECFSADPEVYDSDDETVTSPYEQGFRDLCDRVPVFAELMQADINARIGQFGLLMLGFDDGDDPAKPLLSNQLKRDGRRKDLNLIWMNSYDEAAVNIQGYIQDTSSPMFGFPEYYQIQVAQEQTYYASSNQISPADFKYMRVHWSRCVHVMTGIRRSSKVFCIPAMKPVLNNLVDLRKCYGGSAEMLWQGGFMGLSIEATPNVDLEELTDDDIASIKKQLFAYMNKMQRYIALKGGMTAKNLTPKVADPSNHIQVQLDAVSAATGIPVRVLMGSEQGQQAGQTDQTNWNRRVLRRCRRVVDSGLLRPFVDRLISVGALLKPAGDKYKTAWVDLNALSDKDKADISMKRSQAIAQYVTSGSETVISPLHFFTDVLQIPLPVAQAIVTSAKADGMKTQKVWYEPPQQKTGQDQGAKRPARNGLGGGKAKTPGKKAQQRTRMAANAAAVPGRRNEMFDRVTALAALCERALDAD